MHKNQEEVKPLGEVRRTEQGFQYITFTDRYGMVCSIQQSSLADYEPPGSSAIWLGLDGDGNRTRMHLDLGQVKSLIRVLEMWVESGRFDK